MARPSKAAERVQQINEATLRTLAKYGYAAASLDRIAEEAGLARGHIRHYVGNRQNLIREAAKLSYFGESGTDKFWPESINTVREAVNYLFSTEFIGTREENAVFFGFIEASRSDPVISQILISAYSGAETELAALLKQEYPGAPSARRKQIAFSVVSIAIQNIFLLDISADADNTKLAKSSANFVISTLTNTKDK